VLHVTWIREAARSASLGYRRSDKLRLGAFHASRAFATALRTRWPRSVTATTPESTTATCSRSISRDAEFELLAAAALDCVGELVAEIHPDLGDGDEASLRSLLVGFELSFEAMAFDTTGNRWLMRARRRAAAPA
jgi:hypothetical protein